MKLKLFILLYLSVWFPIIASADIYVITNKDTPVDKLTAKDLGAIYLQKKRYWDNEHPIVAINLSAQTPLREQFTQAVFKRSTRSMGGYWDKISFKGIRPPLIQPSEQAAVLFVQRIPNSITYTSTLPLDNSKIKVLLQLKID